MGVATQVDVAARRATAALLEKFLNQQISGIQLDNGWQRTDDIAVREVERLAWTLYDDIWPETHRPRPDADDFLRRCIDFLKTDLPYNWPVPSKLFLFAMTPLNILTLGQAPKWLGRKFYFPKHWPFVSEEAREQARSSGGGAGHAAPA